MRYTAIVFIGFLSVSSFNAYAQNENDKTDNRNTDISLEATVGTELDSNVTVSDIDFASGLDDIAYVLKAKVKLKHELSDKTSFKSSATYSKKSYDEFSQFDQDLIFGSVELNHKVGEVTLGSSVRYIDANLNGVQYLEAVQISPFASRYFGKKYFGRVYYTFTDKTYAFRPERDGDTHAIGIDAYHFLKGTRQFVTAGYKYESVDAFERQLAYDSHRVKLKFQQKIPIGNKDTSLSFHGRFESRKYKDINFVILEIRDDDRWTYGASLDVPLGADMNLSLDLNFRNFNSNLLLVDYDKTVLGLQLTKTF